MAALVRDFPAWLEPCGVPLTQLTPRNRRLLLDDLAGSVPTKRLAALRRFFDALLLRHAILLDLAASIRAERYAVVEGKIPEIRPALCSRRST